MTANDIHAHGLSTSAVNPLRYSYSGVDRGEVTDRLLSVIPRQSRVLDVGCGTGAITKNLQERLDLNLIGLEPNPERASAARALGLDVRTEILTPELIESLGLFDVVLFADVLEHLLDPVEILRMARAALAPGGVVVASIPNVAHWTIRWNLLRGRFDYQPTGLMDATHIRWFTTTSVRRLFTTAGFTESSYTTTGGTTQPFYTSRFPWRYIHPRIRTRLVLRLSSLFPGLFGFQHIFVAAVAPPAP